MQVKYMLLSVPFAAILCSVSCQRIALLLQRARWSLSSMAGKTTDYIAPHKKRLTTPFRSWHQWIFLSLGMLHASANLCRFWWNVLQSHIAEILWGALLNHSATLNPETHIIPGLSTTTSCVTAKRWNSLLCEQHHPLLGHIATS